MVDEELEMTCRWYIVRNTDDEVSLIQHIWSTVDILPSVNENKILTLYLWNSWSQDIGPDESTILELTPKYGP